MKLEIVCDLMCWIQLIIPWDNCEYTVKTKTLLFCIFQYVPAFLFWSWPCMHMQDVLGWNWHVKDKLAMLVVEIVYLWRVEYSCPYLKRTVVPWKVSLFGYFLRYGPYFFNSFVIMWAHARHFGLEVACKTQVVGVRCWSCLCFEVSNIVVRTLR